MELRQQHGLWLDLFCYNYLCIVLALEYVAVVLGGKEKEEEEGDILQGIFYSSLFIVVSASYFAQIQSLNNI